MQRVDVCHQRRTSSLYEDGSPACCSFAFRHTSSLRLWYSVLLPLSIRVRGSFGSRCTVRSSFVLRRSSVGCVHSSPTSIVVVVVSSVLAVLRVVVLTTPRSSIVMSVATAPSLPPVSRVSSPLTPSPHVAPVKYWTLAHSGAWTTCN